tara:strand:+ start:270 stop:512 length:243 start_codon:yes stop_codon:yes gene_type:complete
MGTRESEGGEVRDMRISVSAEENQTSEVVREGRMPQRNGGTISRVAMGVRHRVNRLKAIGNGQVSIVAALAWEVLGGPTE